MDFSKNIAKASVLATGFFIVGILMMTTHFPLGKVCFKEHCFNVTLAKTSTEQKQGLMFKESLEKDSGMLFIFPVKTRHAFWMKNTKIPLDIIWIDADKKVVFISENTQPCLQENCPSIYPTQAAKYVLEINAGQAQNIGLKVGNTLTLEE